MRLFFTSAICLVIACLAAPVSEAQPPKGGKSETVDEFVAKLLAFDKDKDGKLTKEELTDRRLHALFERADTKKNGYITRVELEALFTREALSGGSDFKGDFKGKKGPFDKKGPPPDKKGPPPDDK